MDPIVLSSIIGLSVPGIVSFLKNVTWPSPVKVALTVAVSVVAAVISLVQDGQLSDASWQQLVANVGVVLAVSQVFYKTYFGNTQLNTKLEDIKVL